MTYKHIIKSELSNDVLKIETLYAHTIRPVIHYNLKGMLNGRAVGDHSIMFNPDVCAVISEEDLVMLVKHEFAHLVVSACRLHKINIEHPDDGRSHGSLWRYVMSLLGVENPKARNMYVGAEKAYGLEYPYRCSCSKHWLSKRRHLNGTKGVVYMCVKCKQPLVPDIG